MSAKRTSLASQLKYVPGALVGMDQKGVIRFVDRHAEVLFGYDRDDLVGQPIELLVPDSLWQIYASHRAGYFSDPRTRSSGLDLELSARHQDGTTFLASISLSHIDTGDVLLVISAMRDVIRQRQAIKDAELTAAVVEYSHDAIVGISIEGTVTSWNRAAETLYGYSRRGIIGRSSRLLAPDDRSGEIFANLAIIKAGRAVEHFATMGLRQDGVMVAVSLTLEPIHGADGAIVGASSIHRPA